MREVGIMSPPGCEWARSDQVKGPRMTNWKKNGWGRIDEDEDCIADLAHFPSRRNDCPTVHYETGMPPPFPTHFFLPTPPSGIPSGMQVPPTLLTGPPSAPPPVGRTGSSVFVSPVASHAPVGQGTWGSRSCPFPGGAASPSRSSAGSPEVSPQADELKRRARQIRNLRKKIRYVNFFLAKEMKERELTQQEQECVLSLPWLQDTVKRLEEEQAKALATSDSPGPVHKKTEECWSGGGGAQYTSEEERVYKTIRALRKKIRFIHRHLERQAEGKQLSPAEKAKVASLPSLQSRLQCLEAQMQCAGRPTVSTTAMDTTAAPTGESQEPSPVRRVSGDGIPHADSPEDACKAALLAQIEMQKRELEEKDWEIQQLTLGLSSASDPDPPMLESPIWSNPTSPVMDPSPVAKLNAFF
eukprot:Hpha_TRINITY_DN15693_c1_g9::TRINITY_DN15693_c1_g9_i1::g.99354::m.99354